jgi:hypothetical protein
VRKGFRDRHLAFWRSGMTLSRMTLPRFQCVCLQGIKWHLTSWGLACCLCWIPSATLWAGDLYRCVGPQGETAFTSDRSGFRDCHVVKYSRSSNSGSLAASATKPVPSSIVEPAPATTAPSQSPVRVDFRTSTNLTEPVASTPPRADRGSAGVPSIGTSKMVSLTTPIGGLPANVRSWFSAISRRATRAARRVGWTSIAWV